LQFPKEARDFIDGRGDILRVYKSGPCTQALLAVSLLAKGRDTVLIVPGERELSELRALIGLFSGESEVDGPDRTWLCLPPHPPGWPSGREWAARNAVLATLAEGGRPRGLILTVDNLLPKWPPPAVMAQAALTVNVGEDLGSELILSQLAEWGYARVPMVTGPGEMAMRGDILDLHPPGYLHPLRLEFFGDTLETIRVFNPASQRSSGELAGCRLYPAAPAILDTGLMAEARQKWAHLKTTGEISGQAKAHLEELLEQRDARIPPGLYYTQPATVSDYLPKDAVFLLAGAGTLRSRLEEAQWAWEEHLDTTERESGLRYPAWTLLWPEAKARKTWLDARQVVFEDLVLGEKKDGVELPEKAVGAFTDLFWKPDDRHRPWPALVAALKDWQSSARQTVVSFHGERARAKFLRLAEQEDLSFVTEYELHGRGLFALVAPLKKGFELAYCQVRVLSEDVLSPEAAPRSRTSDQAFKGLTSQEELKDADLLVHRDYGLARFGGLTRLTVGEAIGDYLLLFFEGEDKLYLPVDRMGLVQRYKGPEGLLPPLDSLRGGRWLRTKDRARKAIEKIAEELVKMYAYRQVAKGYAYSPVNELYWEFEAGFGFEETPDQAKAISDVLSDMDRPEPMDRLVCGDVGFGKTEVALRAAFRAVLDGKQVALLCPTTILAEQHYLNFKRRMQGFPVNVAMLSRFVPKAEQSRVTAAAAKGRVDILIGTHRLLSADVNLPNLGLLILDEEQRFGVKHKEKLKELRQTIDALTLTATPIPRTLQLSLSGIRGLSTIETPPPERKSVQTALIERDQDMLRTILEREIERGGQVFWVHNRVKGLAEVEAYVKNLVPRARVGSAHGQMHERALEETMHAFWHGELDVLVSTAIVESGLDFPNANTLIVDQAQMFGLGQLYQLRGRVGRSDRQAYAYFVVGSIETIPDLARKRLQVIMDMDYLGAGFQVAMEDLRLRGAGNILGEAQSGQMAKVGLDLFLEMLEEEVARLKGEPPVTRVETEVSFVFPALIPETFVPDPGERLRYYRALSMAPGEGSLTEQAMELRDRFGPLPVPLENFMAVLRVKRVLVRLGAAKVELTPTRALISWPETAASLAPETIIAFAQARRERAKLLPPSRLELRLAEAPNLAKALDSLADELAGLLPEPAVSGREHAA